MNIKTLPLKLGCAASIIYVVIFFYYFPTRNDSSLYVILWIIGLFVLPTVIGIMFRAGSTLGLILSFILNIFRFRKHVNEPSDSSYQQKDYSDEEIINIDEYNKPENNKKDDNDKIDLIDN